MTTKKRELTDRQKTFLDVLFDKAYGDVVQAKLLAGYSEHTSTSEIVNSLKKEIMEATEAFMSRNAPKAANRRKSFCARSAGQMKKFPKAAKNPNSRLRQARRRWKC